MQWTPRSTSDLLVKDCLECPSTASLPLVNRSSTARQPLILFLHLVYTGVRLYVHLDRRSGDVSSMPWRVRGSLVPWANYSVGTQFCATPPRRPAVLDPIRPRYVRVLDSTGLFKVSGASRLASSSLFSCPRGQQTKWCPCRERMSKTKNKGGGTSLQFLAIVLNLKRALGGWKLTCSRTCLA